MVLDTGEGPNLIHFRRVHPKRRRYICPVKAPTLVDASKRPMKSQSMIMLLLRVGELIVQVPFLEVNNFEVDCMLGTTLIDQHVKAILAGIRGVYFYHAPSVAITSHFKKSSSPVTQAPLNITNNVTSFETVSSKIRVAKRTNIPTLSQMHVSLQCSTGSLCFVENNLRLLLKSLTLMTNGLMDIVPHAPFTVVISNSSEKPIHLHKETILVYAKDPPVHIISLIMSAPNSSKAKE